MLQRIDTVNQSRSYFREMCLCFDIIKKFQKVTQTFGVSELFADQFTALCVYEFAVRRNKRMCESAGT